MALSARHLEGPPSQAILDAYAKGASLVSNNKIDLPKFVTDQEAIDKARELAEAKELAVAGLLPK